MIHKIKNLYHLLQSLLFNIVYGFPSHSLEIIGVTGTDGKTTTSSMIYHTLKENNLNVALISTIAAYVGDEEIDIGLHVTTPDPWKVPQIIKKIKDKGFKYLVVEATSQGLVQNRLWGVRFSTAVFTNIGHDHLDYHKTWENYAKAKFKLVQQLKEGGTVVINQDHVGSFDWLKSAVEKKSLNRLTTKFYSKGELSNIKQSVEGLEFKYQGVAFKIPVIGEYNLENALACIDACKKYLTLKEIAKGLSTFNAPSGRMEVMQRSPFTVIVDFAHTPDALENALKAVVNIKPKNSKIITVFGCAGKRDKARRRMGEVSAKLSDITLVTAEDPRDEELWQVNDMIMSYGEKAGGKFVYRFKDSKMYEKDKKIVGKAVKESKNPFILFDENNTNSRKDAIDFAISIAEKDDIVFITGKGHEKSLSFGAEEKEYPWSDQEAVKKLIS